MTDGMDLAGEQEPARSDGRDGVMVEDRWGKMLSALRYVSPKDWRYVVPFVEDVLSEKYEAERARADRLQAENDELRRPRVVDMHARAAQAGRVIVPKHKYESLQAERDRLAAALRNETEAAIAYLDDLERGNEQWLERAVIEARAALADSPKEEA